MQTRSKKGMTLAAAVMLIVFASAVALSTAVFITNRLSQTTVSDLAERCLYLAQAGLHYAIYQFRSTGTPFSGTVNIDANNYALVQSTGGGGGGDASYLVVNATASSLGGGNRNLQNITLSNTGSATITIDRMIVTWTTTPRTLQNIQISGANVWTGNIAASPANVDITNTSFTAGQTRPLTRIRWNQSMNTSTMTLQCVMTDGSTTDVCTVFPRPATTCVTGSGSVSVLSMGKTTGSNAYRTVEAVYNSSTEKVTSLKEVDTIVP